MPEVNFREINKRINKLEAEIVKKVSKIEKLIADTKIEKTTLATLRASLKETKAELKKKK